MALALEQVHAVEAETFYFNNGVGRFGARLRGGGVDEKGSCRAGAVVDVWNLRR